MDTTDPDIRFDAQGICNHCHAYDDAVRRKVHAGADGAERLRALVDRVKAQGAGKEYDCIIGVSGGVDSTFAAYEAKRLGLRPLAVHLDNGWDSELAVKNIENTLKKLGIELYTHVIDWNEFKDLQLSFLRASTPDSEIPSDHAIVAIMFQIARRYGVRAIVSGYNVRTESHLPRAWSQGHLDWKYIKQVHRRFGTAKLRTFPRQGLWSSVYDRLRVEVVDILNYVDYSKSQAMTLLEQELGWRYYGGKHYESIYTRFYQGWMLPRKFGYDKRRSHQSSLICSGLVTRDAAFAELATNPYPEDMQRADREYVIKKLGITAAEFDRIIAEPPKRFEDYPSYSNGVLYRFLSSTYRAMRAPKAKA